jgi:isocitrate lyase
MEHLQKELSDTAEWMAHPRFDALTRLYSARQVIAQRGTIGCAYTVARLASQGFIERLRELFAARKSITTFGPYTPGQAVTIKRMGIEGIYLGGWATSAKGSVTEDPGADLAAYPLSQVPDEAAPIVRALLTADRNQVFARSKMTAEQRAATPVIDYRPFIIADADTGHGGDGHVRNLVRRFVEVGVPGYHIEDQRPGSKKCGHQGGKVLVPVDEQIKRLNAARFQLDIMKVPGIIVARTDAEAASLLDGRGDERDHPFILGATNVDIPGFKATTIAVQKYFNDCGMKEVNGHLLYQVSDAAYKSAFTWLDRVGILSAIDQALKAESDAPVESILTPIIARALDRWQLEAGLKTYGEAVADAMSFHIQEGERFDWSVEQWLHWSSTVPFGEARAKARSFGLNVLWSYQLARTPEGFYPVKGGIEYAIARSLAVAPFSDMLWMETKTADLAYARRFAEAIHAKFPNQMLAYNLSPSFNWDTTGMSEEEMKCFPEELGKLGYVFNFITYGGHQVDGVAGEEFATALRDDGMLALARLQRKLRLIESPYRIPQTLVGGPRLDAALMASSGRTATTRAMGKGSTQEQHLVQTEVPSSLLEKWLSIWTEAHSVPGPLRVSLRPHTAGSDLLALKILNESKDTLADIIFAYIRDRQGTKILSIRDQNTFDLSLRKKRLMALAHLFLIYRYKIASVHYVSPTEDNYGQTVGMQALGIYMEVHTEAGQIIVATVNSDQVREFVNPDQRALHRLIFKDSRLVTPLVEGGS